MISWFKKKEASRKFIDLIMRVSSKWANWDPSDVIQAGDYGTIDEQSGAFERQGNIYRDNAFSELAAQYPAMLGAVIEEYTVNSSNARKRNVTADFHVNGVALGDASIKGQWQFDGTRGALLIMHKARMTIVPNEFLAKTVDLDFVKEMLKEKPLKLVSQVFSCPAYALYLSNKSHETVGIALRADVPTVVAPGVSAGAGVDTKWSAEGVSGLFHKGHDHEASFTPLYVVKEIKAPSLGRRRDSSDPNVPTSDHWADVDVPWGFLDEDGEEEAKYTYNSDSE
ncbi:hypothetical protein M0805_001922 [Coniferiporia weirii]|nr:hypothetical protein M0805_001922 [Coniferiporia weirii]